MTAAHLHRSMGRSLRGLCAALAALGALAAMPAAAQTCSVSASPFAFGASDMVDQLDVSNNTITVRCRRQTGIPGIVVSWTVALSPGSGSYAAREMSSGTDVMLYNLYTTAARTVVWGDGTSATGIVGGSITFGAGQKDLSVVHPVHGRIPGNQSPAPGNYATAVPITVTVLY